MSLMDVFGFITAGCVVLVLVSAYFQRAWDIVWHDAIMLAVVSLLLFSWEYV